jgi:ubiquinone/menaquinone biosynthesis C-methylase UbiE
LFDGLVALSGVHRGDEVLDVGCGTGYFAKRAARVVGPDGSVFGIDPSETVVEYATRTAPPNCRFVVAGAERLPFPDNAFDVVVSSLAFHHLPPAARPEALREVCRVLRPEGRLLLVDFRPPSGWVARRLVGAMSGHSMSHNPIDRLPDLIAAAGLTLFGSGDRWPLLRYFQAMK